MLVAGQLVERASHFDSTGLSITLLAGPNRYEGIGTHHNIVHGPAPDSGTVTEDGFRIAVQATPTVSWYDPYWSSKTPMISPIVA